jgi:hypothetical protein
MNPGRRLRRNTVLPVSLITRSSSLTNPGPHHRDEVPVEAPHDPWPGDGE